MHGRPTHVHADPPSAHTALPGIALVAVLGALLLVSLDHTVINVALPQLARELGASGSQLQWIADAYPVAFAGTLLAGGAFGDRHGRRRALVLGLALFALGSALAASTVDAAWPVVAGRALMGVGGGFVMPATLSSLVAMFDGQRRGKAVAAWTATASVGVAIGPLVGGALVTWAGWSSVFWINIPAVAIIAVGVLRSVPENRAATRPHVDPPGTVLSAVAMAATVWSVIEAPADGWLAPTSLTRFALAATAASCFVLWERRTRTPMLDLAAIRRARIGGVSGAITLGFLALGGALFLVAQHLQLVLGFSPLVAGAALLPAALGLGVGTHIADRHPPGAHGGESVAVGLGVLIVGWALVVQVVHIDSSHYLPIGLGLFGLGVGLGIAIPAATNAIVSRMPHDQAGVASAINDVVREVGGALGIAVIGSLATASYATELRGDASLSGLSTQEVFQATDSITGALLVSESAGTPGLLDAAQAAFVHALRVGFAAAAAIAIATAVLSLVAAHRSARRHDRTGRVATPVAAASADPRPVA